MRHILICIMLLGFATGMMAIMVEAPEVLLSFDNLEFIGEGSISYDGSSVLVWREAIDEAWYIGFMRFSDGQVPLWEAPIYLPCNGQYHLECSNEAIFVVLAMDSSLLAYKYSMEGEPVWASEGVEFLSADSYRSYELSLVPDHIGGLWLIWNSVNLVFSSHSAVIQRLDGSGKVLLGSGLVYEGNWDCYYRDSLLLEDNSLLFSLAYIDSHSLVRLADDGIEMYQGDFSSAPFSSGYSALDILSDTKLIYTIGRRDFMDVYILSLEDDMAQLGSYTLPYDDFAAVYVEVNTLGNGVAIISSWDYSKSLCILKKINENGDVLYERRIDAYHEYYDVNLKLHHLAEGEYYIVYDLNERQLKVERISAAGLILWEELITSPENYSGKRLDFLSQTTSDGILIYWMDYRFAGSGIFFQGFSVSGLPLFPEGGVPIQTGSRGFLLKADVLALEQGAVVIMLHKKDNDTNATIEMKLLESSPGNTWPAEGVLISDTCTGEPSSAVKTQKVGENILVMWIHIDTENVLKAQLVSQHGVLLWGPEGIEIHEGDVSSFFGTVIDGSIFIAWQSSNDDKVFCQKVDHGMLQGPSICLYDDTDAVMIEFLKDFTQGYLILGGESGIRVQKLRSDGSFNPEFGENGVLIDASIGSFINSSCQDDDILLINISQGSVNPGQSSFVIISPEGEILLNNLPVSQDGYFSPLYKSGFVYSASYDTHLSISKYNLASECLWTKQFNISSISYDGYISGRVIALTDSSFALMYLACTENADIRQIDYAQQYITFDAEGNGMENPETIYSKPMGYSRKIAVAEDAVHLLYYGFQNFQSLKWQKLSLEATPQTGLQLNPSPHIILGYPYPNPFLEAAVLPVYVEEKAMAKVSVYNIKGQLINRIFADELPSGLSRINWNGLDANGVECAKGIYLFSLEAKGKTFTIKAIKLK